MGVGVGVLCQVDTYSVWRDVRGSKRASGRLVSLL